MVDIKWPPAVLPLSGGELVPMLQGNKVVEAPVGAFPSGGGGGGGTVTVPSYSAIRSGFFNPTQPLFLDDPTKAGMFITGPAARDDGGIIINDSGGQSWYRVFDTRVSAAWYYNAPGHFLGDNVLTPGTALPITITATDIANNPQWIGMVDPYTMAWTSAYPVGTTWDYVALQEWIYALCASRSVPGTVTWNMIGSNFQLNKAGWCPRGIMYINQMLGVNASGLNIEFSQRQACQIKWFGNATGTSNVGPAIQFNSLSYSYIRGLQLSDYMGATNYLISIDHTSVSPAGLLPQANTMIDWFLGGGMQVADGHDWTQALVAICPLGTGNAQGDTHTFINFFCAGNQYDGFVLTGSNIVSCSFYGGNFQGCWRRAMNCPDGSWGMYETVLESVGAAYYQAPQGSQFTLDGADFYSGTGFGASTVNTVVGIRSESGIPCVDGGGYLMLMNSGWSQVWGINSWQAGAHWQIGQVINVPSTSGALYPLAILVDDGGWPWFMSDPTSTTTVLINPNAPGWTANQWVGYGTWLRFGSNGYSNASGIASNDASTLTLTGAYSVSGTHNIKITGLGGASTPNWAGVAYNRFGRAGRVSPGYGMSTTNGSNVVASGGSFGGANFAQIGDWVMVCGGQKFVQPGSPSFSGPMIGKISSITLGWAPLTVGTLVNGLNASTNTSLNVATYSSGTRQVSGTTVAGVLNISFDAVGTGGNAYTLAAGTANVTLSGPTLTGGTATTNATGSITFNGNPTNGQTVIINGVTWTFVTPGPAVGNQTQIDVATPNVTLVDAHGNAVNSTATLTDAYGYWGAGVTDGQLTWMPLDLDAAYGVKHARGVDWVTGRLGACQDVRLTGFPGPGRGGNFIRAEGQGNANNYEFKTSPPVWTAPFTGNANATPLTLTYNTAFGGIGQGNSLKYQVSVTALTINFPLHSSAVIDEFDLILVQNHAGDVVVTWGTNVVAAAPTLDLGTVVTKTTIVHMKWVGNRSGNPAASGSWYVMNINGPM